MAPNLAYVARVADEDLSEAISLRVTPDDRQALDALAARFPLKAMTIARIALRLGLAEVARNPSVLFEAKPVEPAPAPSPVKPAKAAAGKPKGKGRRP